MVLSIWEIIRDGNGNPLQCSCLENPRDGRAWWAAVYGVAQSRTRLKRLSSSSSSSSSRSSFLHSLRSDDSKSYHQAYLSPVPVSRKKKKKHSASYFPNSGNLPLRILFTVGFSGGSEGKASAYNVGDAGSIPGLGRSTGEGNGNPLKYSCLENPMD